MTTTEPITWEGKNINTTSIESRIGDLWKEFAQRSNGVVPVRTHLFNLIIYAGEQVSTATVMKRAESLGYRHPSRTIALVTDRLNPESSVDAELMLVAAPGDGSGCAYSEERVIVTARGTPADHPASLVLSLMVPDLPTYLWWPGQPLFGHRVFHRLLSVASKLVVDSAQFESPGDGFAALAGIARGQQRVQDFHWERLQPWREIVSQFFDGETHSPFAQDICSLRFEFGSGPGVGDGRWSTAGLLLMLGWLASRLGWRPETTIDRPFTKDVAMSVLQRERVIPVDIDFHDHGERAAGHLMCVEVRAQPPGKSAACCEILRFDDMRTVRVTAEFPGENPVERVVPLEIRSDEEILSSLLEVGHDHLYQEVVNMASLISGREVWLPG